MKKIALTLALMLATFVMPALIGSEARPKWPPSSESDAVRAKQKFQSRQGVLLAKDSSDDVAEHGKLFFTITTNPQLIGSPVTGEWRAFVQDPKGHKYYGPDIDANSAVPITFTITVEPPILRGEYTLTFFDLTAEYSVAFPSGFLPYQVPIIVTNSYNHKVGKIFETTNGLFHPEDYFQIFYTPFQGH